MTVGKSYGQSLPVFAGIRSFVNPRFRPASHKRCHAPAPLVSSSIKNIRITRFKYHIRDTGIFTDFKGQLPGLAGVRAFVKTPLTT